MTVCRRKHSCTMRGCPNHLLCTPSRRTSAFIGYVIYHEYDADSMEIGWVLFPEYWGRGYASELTDRLIDRARQAQKGVVIECVPEQTATRHIAGKKGFRNDGVSDGLAVYRLADRR